MKTMVKEEKKISGYKIGRECPCCGDRRYFEKGLQVRQCVKCEAIYGACYKGELYQYVLPYFEKGNVDPADVRYFDFEVLGSDGINRFHGWYNPATKLVVQVG